MRKTMYLAVMAFFTISMIQSAFCCTNILVSKGASTDGSVMISYNADAGGFMEPLFYQAAQDYKPGEMTDVYDWDTHKYLGKIKQVAHTYQVIGNMNEHQVSVGETTFGGREVLHDTTGKVDYGSLMYLALQRAKTAREALKVMTDLANEHGYYSEGESFSVADCNEAWILEMIGKGPGSNGAIWVARRVPEGYICAHANQARIREVPLNDPENCIYSPDIIDFAVKKGFYDPKSGKPFSFVDAYCPLEPGALLACESRVWSIFRRSAPSQNFSPDYWRAVKGAEPYPLFIKPDKKLGVKDVMSFMRDHFEGTEFEMTSGLEAGPYGCPYRWKPLGWKADGDTVTEYYWERPISTQQTAFSFVSQMRSNMPREIAGVFWYSVDDTYSNVYMPLYCSMTRPPESYTTNSIADFSLQSGFWVFDLVANLAYTKYSYIIKDIQAVQSELENKFLAFQPAIEKAAMELYNNDKQLAVDFLTDYSVNQAEMTLVRWRQLWKSLVVKYNDGYINDVTLEHGRHPKGVGYGNPYIKRILEDKPDYFKVQWRDRPEKLKK